MHFLKCNNCGHLNEVKGEYMVFCKSCKKKIENNFTEWKKRNEDKTFDDFKLLICVTESDLQDTSTKKKTKPKGLKYWIGFAVTFAIFYAVGQLGGDQIIKFLRSEKTAKEVLEQKWFKETYGNFGLTVETPVKMTKMDLKLPDNIKQAIEQMDSYNYMSAKGFKIFVNTIKYNSKLVKKVNLQGAANGAVSEVKMQKGVTDFDYTENPISKNNISGIIQKGTFKKDDIGFEFTNTIFSKGILVWQVSVIYQVDDEVGRIASKRVIESIKINYKN